MLLLSSICVGKIVVHQTYINERSYERSGAQLPPPSDRGATVRRLLKVEKWVMNDEKGLEGAKKNERFLCFSPFLFSLVAAAAQTPR